MKYAVIKIGGKQYKVQEDEEILIDKIEGKREEKVTFNEVLLIVDNKKIKIGAPYLIKAKVSAEIAAQEKGKKIRVAKFKAKSRYRRVMGFRSLLTRVKIKKIA